MQLVRTEKLKDTLRVSFLNHIHYSPDNSGGTKVVLNEICASR